MKDFNWQHFTRKIAIQSNVQTIYDAWAIPSEIEKWFLKSAHYLSKDDQPRPHTSHVQVGDQYNWSWYLFDIIEKGAIQEANGVDLFQFTFAGDCEVRIELEQNGDHVVVTLTQNNIPTDDHSKKDIRLGCDSGWSFYLVNLKSVYEGGIDLRNKQEHLKGMLNS